MKTMVFENALQIFKYVTFVLQTDPYNSVAYFYSPSFLYYNL
jgi:hypothetical protein